MERKEAIEIIKKNWPDSSFTMLREALETVIPELKESEDEGIRKDLLGYLHTLPNHFSHNGSLVTEWIAWLEKQGEIIKEWSEMKMNNIQTELQEMVELKQKTEQGEQKSMKTCAEYYNQANELKMPELSEFQNKLADILMYREYDGPDETEDDIAKGRLEYELAAIRLSEELLPLAQKEQKPADKVKPKFKVGQTIIYKGTENIAPTKITISDIAKGQYWDDNCCIVPISDQDNWELVEQKPTWSEEDEKIFRALSNALARISSNTRTDSTSINYTFSREVDWLNSLKDRVQPQPQQEWSEKDEKMYTAILRDVRNGEPLDKLQYDWLKSLRPQNRWKPSEEQIKAVKEAACYSSVFSEKTIDNLISLSKQLNKLREE